MTSTCWCGTTRPTRRHHEAESIEEQGEVTHRFWAVSHADRIQVATAIVERVVAGHRVQPHPARRRAPVEAAEQGGRARGGHPRRPQPEPARAGAGRVRSGRRARARRHRRRRPRHPRRRRGVRAAVRPAGHGQGLRPPLRAHGPRRRRRHGDHVRVAREGEGRPEDAAGAASPGADRGGHRRYGGQPSSRPCRPSRSTAATGSTACPAASGHGPQDRPRQDRGAKPRAARATARARARARSRASGRPAKPGKHAATKGRNGQEHAGAPARSGRPGTKPGRRPAGAGAARPGRPAGGNRRRAR